MSESTRSTPPPARSTGTEPTRVTEKLKAERIQLLARRLPRWRLSPGNNELRRTWSVPGLRAGTALAGALAAVVEERKHPAAAITITPSAVAVALTTPAAGGLTAHDFDVASALEFGA